MDGALIAGEGRLVAAAGCDIGAAVCLQEGRLLAGPDGSWARLTAAFTPSGPCRRQPRQA